MFYQQGDMLIKRIARRPIRARWVGPGHGRLVLARGEATGHTHAIEKVEGARCYALGEILYLVVVKEVEVTHPEHRTLILPPGVYQLDHVREYDYAAEEARRVLD